MRIRDAEARDASAIAEIFNESVLHSAHTWTTDTVTPESRAMWIEERSASGFPVLVGVDGDDDGAVLGYATYGVFRAAGGYRHTVEHSVYVDAAHQGKGYGRALLEALIERAQQAGDVHVMMAVIAAENVGSIRLHERFGFDHVARLPEVGRKFDRWLDLVLMQRVFAGSRAD